MAAVTLCENTLYGFRVVYSIINRLVSSLSRFEIGQKGASVVTTVTAAKTYYCKLLLSYSNSFNWPYFGEFLWTGITKDCI